MFLKTRILARQPVLGTWLNLGCPYSAEIAGLAGFDWVLIDREHGAGSDGALPFEIMAAELGGAAPIVRVSATHEPEIKRALDHGAAGIMVPQVHTPRQAAEVVQAVRIPPAGRRGAASSTRASRYGFGYRQYLENANDLLITMVQIESVEAVEQCAEIAKLDGVDVLFVGPTDLSSSLHVAGLSAAQDLRNALVRVSEAASAAGKAAGILARTQDQAQEYLAAGFNVIALESDRGLLAKGFKAAAEELRARLEPQTRQ